MSLSMSSGEWLSPSVAINSAFRSARRRNHPRNGPTINSRSFTDMVVIPIDDEENTRF